MFTQQQWHGDMFRRAGGLISIAQLGQTLSESIGPASIVALLALFDWRSLWIGLPIIAFCILAPFIRYLTPAHACKMAKAARASQATNHGLKKHQLHSGNGGDPKCYAIQHSGWP